MESKWYFFNAQGKVLGDLATDIARILIGKNKPTFTPGVLNKDKIVVTNAAKIVLTGRKESQKVYRRHSNFPGGLKTEKLADVRVKNPKRILREAVMGMLPINKLRKRMITNLYIYPGVEHPHVGQEKQEEKA